MRCANVNVGAHHFLGEVAAAGGPRLECCLRRLTLDLHTHEIFGGCEGLKPIPTDQLNGESPGHPQ
eukprot:4899760-Prorocentrum_lima.AAC.1